MRTRAGLWMSFTCLNQVGPDGPADQIYDAFYYYLLVQKLSKLAYFYDNILAKVNLY